MRDSNNWSLYRWASGWIRQIAQDFFCCQHLPLIKPKIDLDDPREKLRFFNDKNIYKEHTNKQIIVGLSVWLYARQQQKNTVNLTYIRLPLWCSVYGYVAPSVWWKEGAIKNCIYRHVTYQKPVKIISERGRRLKNWILYLTFQWGKINIRRPFNLPIHHKSKINKKFKCAQKNLIHP